MYNISVQEGWNYKKKNIYTITDITVQLNRSDIIDQQNGKNMLLT